MMESRTIFNDLLDASVVLNRCVSLVRSTIASLGGVLTLRGDCPMNFFDVPPKSCVE